MLLRRKLRNRGVVSSVICTPRTPDGVRIALFKRNLETSYYADQNPEAAASREILEETGLGKDDVKLLTRGAPYQLEDKELNTLWTIHPFAWQFDENASGKTITLDREHEKYVFISPKDVKTYDHVPQLDLALKRVLISPMLEEGLAALSAKHSEGTQVLAVEALTLLLNIVEYWQVGFFGSKKEFWDELRWVGWHIMKNGLPAVGKGPDPSLAILKVLLAVQARLTVPGGVSRHLVHKLERLQIFTIDEIALMMDFARTRSDKLVKVPHRKKWLEKTVFSEL
ncbi:hypothetical protein M7I_4347 [Glarea lozoyensis 74030]|uniref:Nudix hydrolase domain-containing protein n=1 Tax=Glarea lozoyensis (strain ATCC 74030 / MF5533) TaxID=1104152 RepID=H0ENY2_GLAL7|nr:hypothetical protein M7I_4347 [Glarea lozoyensis 74030]